ncbi:MAG TPA: alpha/beta hydrolase [Thermoanaerobaculia bacterium]|nr:alpha/beta hydrolase [Thermoanaerobaculia bacterium]
MRLSALVLTFALSMPMFASSAIEEVRNAEIAAPVQEGFVAADDGVKLYYRKIGRGPITLIVPLDNVLFREFRQFADIATVITYDMRNRGKSQRAKDAGTWTIQQDVRDLEAVRRHFKVERFVPAGYSYLGLMVILYTLEHPEHVTRVVQINPGPFRHLPEEPAPEAAAAFAAAQKNVDPKASPRDQCIAFWDVFKVTFVGDPKNAAKFDLSFCEHENEWGENIMPHFKKLFESIDALTITPEQLQKVKVPVLTIHGTKDRNAPYASGVDWAKTLPDARLLTIEGAAHASWLDEPVTVFGSIRHFLRGEWPLGATSPAR